MDVVHRGRVIGRRALGEVGELLDGHPDDRQDRQEDDLDDGKIDRGQEPPDALAQLSERVGGGAGGRCRPDRGRCRHGRALDADGGSLGHARDLERGREVVLEVLEILEPDGDTEQAGRDPRGRQLGLGHLAL